MADAVLLKHLSELIESDETIELLKSFVKTSRNELENIYAEIERLSSESYRKKIQIYDVKASIRSVADSAVLFVDSVDDLFYYCKETDFQEIKRAAAEDNLIPLEKFVALMDWYLKQIGLKYESFLTDCKTSIRECNAAAEKCCILQAEAKTRKNASRLVGGVTTSALIVGGTAVSIIAGIFTFGIGTAIGLPITAAVSATAGVATHFIAEDFAKAEDVFRSYSSKFSSLTSLALQIKDNAAEVHREVERFENSHGSLHYLDNHTYYSICTTLDRLHNLSSANRLITVQCLQEVKRCKDNCNI